MKSSHRINERLRSQAAKVTSKYEKLSGRKRYDLLQHPYRMAVLSGEYENIDDIEHQVQHLEETVTKKDEETTELLQEMAVLVAEDTPLNDITNVQSNTGKKIEEVSPRQARRKMSKVTEFTKQALWFA